MVNFGPRESVPAKYSGRLFYQHNATVTLMRTTREENARLGEIVAQKANAARGPVTIVLPLRGVSGIDCEGKPFYDPDADATLFEAIRRNARVRIVEVNAHINDAEFANRLADEMALMLANAPETDARV
jgi:uncharacterized protein (UPF0261 family)